MPMPQYVSANLNVKTQSDFHDKILNDCKTLVDMSRDFMETYYATWDANDELYRASKTEDRRDKVAALKKEPTKMSVPLTYSQVQTFVAFIISLYHQRRYFFELTGNNMTGHTGAKVAEALLERDLNHNVFSAVLYQYLLDIARFSFGVIKHSWVKETEEVWQKKTIPGVSLLGFEMSSSREEMTKVKGTKFLGNKLMNISPYRFFPDIRLPITRFQDGEFCASEDEYTFAQLKSMERDGIYSGVDFIPAMSKEALEGRGDSRFPNMVGVDTTQKSPFASEHASTIVVTNVQIKLIPKKYLIDGKPLGPEDYPVNYIVEYANDNRVIRCEPMGYMHGQFTYDVAQFSPDQHKTINESLCDMVAHLQDVINWFINSHITSVRKTISNQFIADPTAFYMEDFRERKAVIRLKPNACRLGVDKWIKQLQVVDVTGNHISDANALHTLMQYVTGISDNMLGQFHTGRRSATEARNTSVASANRLVLIAKLIFDTSLEPLGRKMLSNHRDGLDEKTYVKLLGDIPGGLEAYNGFVPVDRNLLIGEYDFEIFDGTLASEKVNLANTLQEIIIELIKQPEAIPIIGWDLKKLFREMVYLRGVKNAERFDLALPTNPNPQVGVQNGQIPGQPVVTGPQGAGLPPEVASAGVDLSKLITGGETPAA